MEKRIGKQLQSTPKPFNQFETRCQVKTKVHLTVWTCKFYIGAFGTIFTLFKWIVFIDCRCKLKKLESSLRLF